MASAPTQAQAPLSVASAPQAAPRRWKHPFDSASGTISLGVLLTLVLFMALNFLGG